MHVHTKEQYGAYLHDQRKQRLEASRHVTITTPRKQSQPQKLVKTSHCSSEQILIVRNPATGKTQVRRMFPSSNTKYTPNVKTDGLKELSLKGDTQGV